MVLPRWLLGLCLWWLSVTEVWTATFRLALVGPWTCDPMFSRALPTAAVNLALSRLRGDSSLSYWYDVKLLDEDCSTSKALTELGDMEGYGHAYIGPFNPTLCQAASLLAEHWEAGLASPGCLNADWPNLPPIPPPSRVLFTVLRFFQWAHVGVISAPADIWRSTGQEVASSLRALGLPVGPVVNMETWNKDSPRDALQAIRDADKVKVVILCMSSVLIGGTDQRKLLLAALDMGMVSEGYVFIPYDALLYALPYQDTVFPQLTNSTQLRHAYGSVLTVTMASDQNFYEAFRQYQMNREIRSAVAATEVSPFFGTIFNMVYFVAKAVEERRQAGGGRWVTGDQLVHSDGGFDYQGFNQVLHGGRDGHGMQASYVVLDCDGDRFVPTHSLEPTHTVGPVGNLKPLRHSFSFPGGKPPSASFCWFDPDEACKDADAVTFFFFFILICVLLGAIFFWIRNRRGADNTSKLILTLDDIVFIDTQVSKKKLNDESIMRSLLEIKTPFRSIARSYILTTPESSNIGIMEGDWVWLKKFPVAGNMKNVNLHTQRIFSQLRDMRHENLNLYLGLFVDSGIFAIVVEHCPRGSLADLLADSEMRLDWMFKSSLLMDLIKGMKHLHLRGLSHGRLKSTNCLIDGRFVLKITDYGIPMIIQSESLQVFQDPQDFLWTAPEILRNPVKGGTTAGDVFSFSIIIQEVISRTLPYAMMDMPPLEIVERLKKPPPLCRPMVSVDEAPAECLSLMNECWNEDPAKRPGFDEIFKQFRGINRGKKANIIDSMLRMLEQYSSNLEDLIRERTDELEVERSKTDKLVGQLLPKSVAQALKKGKPVRPEHYSDCTLYFSDIVGFTTISALSEPIEVVDLLNDLYTMFDAIIASHDVYKVETIGDAYMVASGVPNRNGHRHAAEVANMSLDILHSIGAFKIKHMPEIKVKIRIGLHSGPVVAGVVGLTMPRYCLFGDTVTTASHMEASGLPYRIHISLCTVKVLSSLKLGYRMETRKAQVKGSEDTFWLVGRDGFNKPLPVPPDLKGGASNHGISLDEIPVERRQKFLDRQKRMKK
ncbi:retinal guanylyl cyclase 2-like [Corythoichthys intestinalis]|uniref:retinal guanylyl cyclase 2-like n=1 Tax=Corythoichthys intestinalis TaxID=161448 RepID=UPI0025A5E460|nr:retinal guanylyl cyclase 2-like [Corythoichthys intestinalis]XP_057710070.1 retinal guanylyl cyclase 2-like [Corythoichthys intestinalis]XP_057710071.1 retinal guanylyl cyclase 2-like [Corythoichthys intestinalis]XP_057710072.1 retinal guanylyl cyclase 2-like [Corythoichthys intestinalis]